jgi:DNA polymerase sigma
MSLGRLKRISNRAHQWEEILKSLISRITRLESSCSIYIFGSFVRDELTAESDIDLCVIVPDSISPKQFYKDLYSSGPVSPSWPLDLLIFRKSDYDRKSNIGGVCFDIKIDGVELYPFWRLNEPTSKKI